MDTMDNGEIDEGLFVCKANYFSRNWNGGSNGV
jgi:hypothetical protein